MFDFSFICMRFLLPAFVCSFSACPVSAVEGMIVYLCLIYVIISLSLFSPLSFRFLQANLDRLNSQSALSNDSFRNSPSPSPARRGDLSSVIDTMQRESASQSTVYQRRIEEMQAENARLSSSLARTSSSSSSSSFRR